MSNNQSLGRLQDPWKGENKLVIGVDVGITQSGVTFAYLQQGANQAIHRVTQWPGQEAQKQENKIPSLVWYDSDNKAVSFGAEALSPQAEEDAEDNGWMLAKHFKLHLHPSSMQPERGLRLDPLPPGVSLRQIYADFLGYLLQHTKSFFEDRILDGKNIWAQFSSEMEVVIAHPNGWGIREQAFLRQAAVEAGFADSASARTKIRFVTEAEASVHFCNYHANLGERLRAGVNFVVCDAGGLTVDTTVYSVTSTRPMLQLEEKRASACVQAGAIFVDAEAEKYLRSVLRNAGLSPEDIHEYTQIGIKDFESCVKRAFRDPAEEHKIMIGGTRFNNTALNTRRGRMALAGHTLKSFFDFCIGEIIASVDQQVEGLAVSYILLVGGFGDSPYLRQEFKKRYEPRGMQVTILNDSTSKAVADGLVMWFVNTAVYSRALRHSLGIIFTRIFKPYGPERPGRFFCRALNRQSTISGGWSQIILEGVPLPVEAVCRESFVEIYESSTPEFAVFEVAIFSHPGDQPKWAFTSQGQILPGFNLACTIKVDLTQLSGALIKEDGINGPFWSLEFDVCVRLGGTELEAFSEWKEGETTYTGPVVIIPERGLRL